MAAVGTVRGSGYAASLNVDGRGCAVRPVPGSALGRATGLVVVARTDREVAAAAAWMPGRVLVLSPPALDRDCLRRVLAATELSAFAGLIVLADDRTDLGPLAAAQAGIPMVRAIREPDRDRIRRAVRAVIDVSPVDTRGGFVPSPRRERQHRSSPPITGSTVPGTIEPSGRPA